MKTKTVLTLIFFALTACSSPAKKTAGKKMPSGYVISPALQKTRTSQALKSKAVEISAQCVIARAQVKKFLDLELAGETLSANVKLNQIVDFSDGELPMTDGYSVVKSADIIDCVDRGPVTDVHVKYLNLGKLGWNSSMAELTTLNQAPTNTEITTYQFFNPPPRKPSDLNPKVNGGAVGIIPMQPSKIRSLSISDPHLSMKSAEKRVH